jgi:hypothetical protein
MGDEPLLAGYKDLMRDLYSAQGYYARCHRVIERVGASDGRRPVPASGISWRLRRGPSWASASSASAARTSGGCLRAACGRGHHALRRAFMFAIQGEHLIRYTDETVLPRIDLAPWPRCARHPSPASGAR